MKTTHTLIAGMAAGAMALSSATPAMARGDGIGAGEIIAGALVIGGLAAVAASADNDGNGYYARDGRGNRRWDDGRYGRGNSRQAVEQCVRAAEARASRYSYGRAQVTDIRRVERQRGGYEVSGRIAVNRMGRGWRSSDPRYGSGWGNDYRGWDNGLRGYDSGKFTCDVRYGRVVNLDFRNIRGL